VIRAHGEPEVAARLLAAATKIADREGHALSLEYQRGVIEKATRDVREDLAERFEDAWDSGMKLTADEALALALGAER
jgi:hypothetical protein